MDRLLTLPKPPLTSQVCELATEELPCGVLKNEREKTIQRHEAATTLQAYWRGTWVRQCLTRMVSLTPEILKLVSLFIFSKTSKYYKVLSNIAFLILGNG